MKCEIFHPFLPKKTARFTSILLAPHCVFHFLFPVLHLHIHKYQFSGDLTQQVLQMKSIRHQGFLFFYFYTESKKKKKKQQQQQTNKQTTKQNKTLSHSTFPPPLPFGPSHFLPYPTQPPFFPHHAVLPHSLSTGLIILVRLSNNPILLQF